MIDKPEWSPKLLTALLAAIKHSRPPRIDRLVEIAKDGWFRHYQIENLCWDVDLGNHTEALLHNAGIVETEFYNRPRRGDRSVGADRGLRAAEMTQFLIWLERLGLPASRNCAVNSKSWASSCLNFQQSSRPTLRAKHCCW